MKTKFKDLSFPLKVAIIFSWIIGGIWCIGFILGIILGVLGI